MTRLQSELQRLFEPGSVDAEGRVRRAVLALAKPAGWEAIAAVWRGVQADLDLPAPAIAVSGTQGYQLWFSLSAPVPAPQAQAFIDGLRARYLPRDSVLPPEPALPPRQVDSDRWSAFVAPDLAPVFADEPWLDTPPSPDGQADLLARLASIKAADFHSALARLHAAVPQDAAPPSARVDDPKRFLLNVMNDDTVALALRIDAAKALLPWFESPARS